MEVKVQCVGYVVWKTEEEIKEKFKFNSVDSLTASLCNPQSVQCWSRIRPKSSSIKCS